MTALVHAGPHVLAPLVTSTCEHVSTRFIDFFTSNIRNSNTRKA